MKDYPSRMYYEKDGIIFKQTNCKIYAVSKCGKVMSLRKMKILKQGIRNGYSSVVFFDESLGRKMKRWNCLKGVSFSVHRVVLETWTEKPEWAQCVRHLNGVKTDNRIENLSWGTFKQNEADKLIHGTRVRGSKQHLAILKEEQVLEIYRRVQSGERQIDVSRDLGLNRNVVINIMQGYTWSWLTGAEKRER